MVWLEVSKDSEHGGGDWSFGRALWSPTRKRGSGARWPWWETLRRVRAGDPVLHLRGKGQRAAFVGWSAAEADGRGGVGRPPVAGAWDYAESFYYVPLTGFVAFPDPIPAWERLRDREAGLRAYVQRNAARPHGERRTLFLNVKRDGRVRVLEGSYLSEVDGDLLELLLGGGGVAGGPAEAPSVESVRTSERVQELRLRVGQREFSWAVRENFGHRCCFPGCTVKDGRFLVGAHIVRWADDADSRGDLANGLCLCLMHDRAFELGYFALLDDLRVEVLTAAERAAELPWLREGVVAHAGGAIAPASVRPSAAYVRRHRERVCGGLAKSVPGGPCGRAPR